MRNKYTKQRPRTVRLIRRLERHGVPRHIIASMFDTCLSNVSYIARHITWTGVGRG